MHEFNYDTFLLALTMQREARGEGRDGMRAVGHVVRNRNLAGWGSIYDCITKKNQFSSISVLGDSQTIYFPKPADFLDTCYDARRIMEGNDGDITGGALYYYNPKTATSPWFLKTIVSDIENHPTTIILGNHTFYK